ncbi:MAG: matrixin family metalloprotease [Halobacillus sp.]|uniref:matrixin family metalloprotease n=1 Tax=Halobacillus sp. TaxID=56800 RepID=UPI003BB1564A
MDKINSQYLSMGDQDRKVIYLKKYLKKFGYYHSCPCLEEAFCKHLDKSVKDYQLYFGLSITGNLDEPTITQMQKPRCGLPDLLPGEDVREKVNDYSLSGGRWENTNIRYFFQNGTSDISGTTEWDIMRQAMDRWADVTPLTFTQVTTEADADIRFLWATGSHGDDDPFDGFGNVLAHAFYPPPVNSRPTAGDVHFDNDEKWDTEDGGFWWWRRRDLLTVAIHEVGHALGLAHSTIGNAIMWPTYEGERRTLHSDDIEGIQALYGSPVRPAGSRFAEASMWALKNTGGYGTISIDLGRPRRFVAWGTITMMDSLSDLDRDNAVVAEVFQVDGIETWKAVSGGDHWGAAGNSSNVHQGAYVGFGQTITFRIRSMHPNDMEAYGVGSVMVLDE